MKKYMDKFKSNIRINKNLFIFLLIIVIVGITSGAIFSVIIDSNDKKMVVDYMSDFFNNVQKGKLNFNTSIINTLVFTVGFGILVWLLGISVIGFFIVIFLLFLKSFVLGFGVASIIINFKFKGILIGLIYAFPHQVINVLVFILLSAYALIVSFKIINSISGKKVLDFKNIINRYVKVLIISIVILILTSLYEVYVMPRLLNVLLGILK